MSTIEELKAQVTRLQSKVNEMESRYGPTFIRRVNINELFADTDKYINNYIGIGGLDKNCT